MDQKLIEARSVFFVFDLMCAIAGVEIILKLPAVIYLIEGIRILSVRIVIAFEVGVSSLVVSVEACSVRDRAFDLSKKISAGFGHGVGSTCGLIPKALI